MKFGKTLVHDTETSRGPAAQLDRRWLFRAAACAPPASLVAACSGLPREPPIPPSMADQVMVLGIPNARFWPDTQTAAMVREAEEALTRERAVLGTTGQSQALPPAHFLAISGGGDDGPFGAGILAGWSDAGTIPTFKLVTGVSTGSMIAPFAFLGRSHLDRLRAMYTTVKADDILESRGLYGALFGEALADTTPLYRLISRYFDEQVLAAVANEYTKGRLLFLATTNLDEQRPIIWNIGAIAASGRPGALELVRKIILASASIPGVFPPVMLDVEVGGRRYQEMNVDGGAVAQTFLYPPDVSLSANVRSAEHQRERHAYIILNGRLDPDWKSVNRRFLTITGRAISTMIHYSGYNDIFRIYATTKRDGVDYNLTYIEADFPVTEHAEFDPGYMKSLYEYAYAKARRGLVWHKQPPLLEKTAGTPGTRVSSRTRTQMSPRLSANR